MARHGYDDDDFDIVDADGWNQYDSYAMRRAPQQTPIHMTQQMTTKVAPVYMMGEPASLPLKMQSMTGVTLRS